MGGGGNVGGAAHGGDFVGVLDQAHFVQQRAHVVNFVRRADAAAHLFLHAAAQAEQARIPGAVCAEGGTAGGLVGQQLGEHVVQLRDGEGLVEAETLLRRLRAVAEAVPDFAFQVFFAAEQDGLRRLSRRPTSTSTASGSSKPVR